MSSRRWLAAWRVLVGLALANLVGMVAYAGHGLFVADAPGQPSFGFAVIVFGAVVIFAIALVFALLLRADVAKRGVSAFLILLGLLVVVLTPVRPELTVTGVVGSTFVAIFTIAGIAGLLEARGE